MTTLYSILAGSIVWEVAADQPGDLYTDTGGTTPASNGNTVAAWRSTANGSVSNLSTQSTAGARPTYRTNYASSGYPALQFDGGDGLIVPHDSAFNTATPSMLAVVTAEDLASFRFAYSRVSDGNWNTGQVIVSMTGSQLMWAARGYSGGIVLTMSLNERRALVGTLDTNTAENTVFSSSGRFDSRAYGSAYSHSQNGGIGNGGAAGGSYPWLGAIHHLIFVNRALRLNEVEWCKYLLSERWGLGLTEPPAIGGSGMRHPLTQQVIG